MSGLSNYLKKNKAARENLVIAPTKFLCDEDGKPVLFTFRPMDSKENARIQDECTKTYRVGSETKIKVDNKKYGKRVLAETCIEPDLHNAELQDSYGVDNAEDLISEMIDVPGEYDSLVNAVFEYNGYNKKDESVEEAKN